MKRYIINLTKLEREALLQLTTAGRHAARKMLHARILLKADAGIKDADICEHLNVSVRTERSNEFANVVLKKGLKRHLTRKRGRPRNQPSMVMPKPNWSNWLAVNRHKDGKRVSSYWHIPGLRYPSSLEHPHEWTTSISAMAQRIFFSALSRWPAKLLSRLPNAAPGQTLLTS